MTCTYQKHLTAADILPTIPEGMELRMKRTQDNIKSFLLLNQPLKNQQATQAYTEIEKLLQPCDMCGEAGELVEGVCSKPECQR